MFNLNLITMKKLYILTCFIGMSVWLFGQTYLTQDFSSNQMPPAGWTIDGYASQWAINSGNEAGGIPPEAIFNYIQAISTSRLISPAIDMTGVSSVKLVFNHMYDWFANPAPTVSVSSRSGGGSWNTLWQITPTGNVAAQSIILDLTGGDLGQPDFQLSFLVNGNFWNLDYWYIDEILLYNPLNLDAALSSVNLPTYIQAGDNVELTGTVKNLGSDVITSFDVSYTIDGGTPYVYSVSGLNLASFETYDFTHDTPINLTTSGTYEIVTTIENVNGGVDQDPSNNTITKYIGVIPFIPPKKVFAEEATGTWCGWCVRGICFMDYMAETYPDTWIGVAVHNGDPMVVPEYDAAIPSIIPNFPGYPSGTLDRAGDNYWDPSEFEAGYFERMDAISPATIDIVNFSWDPVTRVVTFDLRSIFIVDIYNELRFCAVMTEDSLWGTTSQWAQANYYSGGGSGVMCGFELLPGTIPAADMHYDHVARAILDTPYGTVGSIPSPVTAGTEYFYTYTYTLPETWIYEKMHLIGLVIDMSSGEVLNSNDVINYGTGLNEVKTAGDVSIYPNPTTGEIYLTGAKKSAVYVYSSSGMLISTYKDISNNMIDLSNLENGIYILNIVSEDNSVTNKKISIMK
jgi:hypothetical protein